MSTPQQLVLTRVNEIIELAKTLYNLDLSKVNVRFDLKGSSAGMAGFRGIRGIVTSRNYYVRFNTDLLNRETQTLVNDVVGHELAHTICQMNPSLGRNHDHGWARVCRSLGSNDSRTHSMAVVYGRGNTYEYIAKSGRTVRLSQQRHNAIQCGRKMDFTKGIGLVDRTCTYTIVGSQGRTLDCPVPGRTPAPNATVANARVSFGIGAAQVQPALVGNIVVSARTSKADVARHLMSIGHASGHTVETIIAAIMLANGHQYALAKSYYKNNAVKMGFSAI